MAARSQDAVDAAELVDRVLSSGPPAVLYQPVVDLSYAGTPVVGYEALARWPSLSGVSTAALFDAAERSGRVAELDWACRSAAVRGALNSGIDTETALFVNVEPAASLQRAPDTARQLWRSAAERLSMVLEITERRMLDDASALLAAIGEAREVGWWIAVDDVGVNPESLAMLEFIRPDMVKLDLGFVQRPIDADAARTLRGVAAYCERTGATLIAEGIETEEQLERAVGVGAALGQGYLFGHPGVLQPASAGFRAHRVSGLPSGETPYSIVSKRRGYRIARKTVLKRLSDEIEQQIDEMTDPPVVLTAMQTAAHVTPGIVQLYSRFAARSPLVVMLAADMPREPVPGAHGSDLPPGDALRDEWALVVLGTYTSIALAAQDLGDTGPDGDRRFRYTMTQDRDLVVAAGVSLLNRLVQAQTPD